MANGGVLRSPGNAARGLADWAVDLWPYVNGKALTYGIRLGELDASDMLDILHFFFEEDNHYVSGESAKSRDELRKNMYRTMYNREYKYAHKEQGTNRKTPSLDDWGTFSDEDAAAFNQGVFTAKQDQETKPYIPPTSVNADSPFPFGTGLDSPLN